MHLKEHWNKLYDDKKFDEVTWYQDRPKISLKIIESLNIDKNQAIIDVGTGSSRLIDFLIGDKFRNLTALDISENAIKQTKIRLGDAASKVHWIFEDVLNAKFEHKFFLWHDRAVFHFLLDQDEQKIYRDVLNKSLIEKGYFIISTFAEDGPLKCSGLPVKKYHKDDLIDFFKESFKFLTFQKELHISPGGIEQKFNYWVFQKK